MAPKQSVTYTASSPQWMHHSCTWWFHAFATTNQTRAYTLLHCPRWEKACKALLVGHQGMASWESLTERDIRPKHLLQFMASAGLITSKRIITNDSDARKATYELGVDI